MLTCTIAQPHWLNPARWMNCHLLDGDLASNMLSWQWVASSFSSKKYYANQENINKYIGSFDSLNIHYTGKIEPRTWLFEQINQYHGSFF